MPGLHALRRNWVRSCPLARRAAIAMAFCCALGPLSGCAVTERMDRMNARIEEMNGRMAQLNSRVETLGKGVEKLDETNKRLGDLREHAGTLAKQMGTIEKVARKFGGGTSLEDEAPPIHESGPVIERAGEPAIPLGQAVPALPGPAASKSASLEHSALVPPSAASVAGRELERAGSPAPEVAEPKRVEQRVGMRVITVR